MGSKQKVWWSNGRFFSAFCLMNTKLTGNEFYRYKIEAQQCFTLKWFHFEPSSWHICFIGRNLDWQSTMLTDHASQWIHISRFTTVFHHFFRFTLCLHAASRKTPSRPWYNCNRGKRSLKITIPGWARCKQAGDITAYTGAKPCKVDPKTLMKILFHYPSQAAFLKPFPPMWRLMLSKKKERRQTGQEKR